ncbi:MAG: 2-alkenal reductase [Candidatus Parcubacteria bacterium]|nr:MAG: 2-alkenal reductase [Candidatus Parcubacteria bacterium]
MNWRNNILFFIIALYILGISLFSANFAIGSQDNWLDYLRSLFNYGNISTFPSYPYETKQQSDFLRPPLTKNITSDKISSIFDFEDAIISLVDKANPAVVSIVITKYVPIVEQYYINPFSFDDDFPLPPEIRKFFQFQIPQYKQKEELKKEKVGGGSGFIVSKNGLIATNKHVVSDPKAEYTVYLNNGKKYDAKVLAVHPVDDLALLKINADNLPVLPLGDSDNIKIGQFVIAIGNALGEFQNTVSFGLVSGLRRSLIANDERGNIEKLEDLIQTDAAINFGNSGGPLLNLKGEVIAINTAIASGAENIGFAIPVNRLKKMIDQINKKGFIEVPFLGVYYILIDEAVQKEYKLPVSYGAYVYNDKKSPIIPNSPAAKAGLRNGDIILSVDNEMITTQKSLAQIIAKKEVGQKITLKVLRDNKEILIDVTLDVLPKNLPD